MTIRVALRITCLSFHLMFQVLIVMAGSEMYILLQYSRRSRYLYVQFLSVLLSVISFYSYVFNDLVNNMDNELFG